MAIQFKRKMGLSKRMRFDALNRGKFVFIISRLYREDGDYTYGLLDSYDGIRVYPVGKLDYRLTMGGEEPYKAKTLDDAHEYMLGKNNEHEGELRPVQVDLVDGYFLLGPEAFAENPF